MAAPVFRRVAQVGLRTLGFAPKGGPAETLSDIGKEPEPGPTAASSSSSQPVAIDQPPPLPALQPNLPHPAAAGAKPVLDVKGMPAAKALKTLMRNGFVPTIEGSGIVVSQDPAPGTMAPEGTPVHLRLRPYS